MSITALALYARNDDTRREFRRAAERARLAVVDLTADPSSLTAALRVAAEVGAGRGIAIRAPGGLVASAMAAGAAITLSGPTPDWFASLDPEVTGRRWELCSPAHVRRILSRGKAFVKLADGKHSGFPATRFDSVAAFDRVVAAVTDSAQLQLLATAGWLSVDSEYRLFTVGREVTAQSPYRVQDEPWSRLLHTHRASFHEEALRWAEEFLSALPEEQLPPAAVLDVARLTDGRFVLLEVNQCWGAGLYGCDPDGALRAVLAANAPGAVGGDEQWLWRPDPSLRY